MSQALWLTGPGSHFCVAITLVFFVRSAAHARVYRSPRLILRPIMNL